MRFCKLSLAFAVAAAGSARAAQAQSTGVPVKIGVLSDMSSLYADIGGPGSVVAAKMAVEEFDPAAHGMKVESSAPITRTSRTSAPARPSMVRRRPCRHHRDVPTSSVALAVSDVTREKNKVSSSPARPFRSHRPEMLAQHHPLGLRHLDARQLAPASALVKTGGDTWYFLTATMPSATRSSATPPQLFWPTAARCSAV